MDKKYLIDNKELMKEYYYEKNKDIDLSIITLGLSKKLWWKCPRGHEWKAAVNKRNEGTGCPYCSGSKILKGYNDLATTNPEVLNEWNYEKNTFLPTEISKGSGKKVWWKCSNGHDYLMSIANKTTRKYNCPICSNRIVLKGYNDLKTKFPQIAKEWNYEKNGELLPDNILSGSNKKVWWKCSNCGYEWEASIVSRTSNKNGCRNCAINSVGNKIIKKNLDNKGSLTETHPNLIKEWNYEKNKNLNPKNFHYGSTQKVWWKCPLGHEFQQIIYARTKDNYNCPICAKESHSSFPEQAIFFYCNKYLSIYDVNNRYMFREKNEADIYIEKLNLVIEYDGAYYHNNKKAKEKEERKNEFFLKNNIKLIRIKENINKDAFYNRKNDILGLPKNPSFKQLDDMLIKLFNRIFDIYSIRKKVVFNTEKDRFDIMDSYIFNEKENSLLIKNPKLAKEWNYEKNGNLKPEMVTYSSGKKVWWKCSKGHEWEYTINDRNHGDGCPICSNRKVLEGYNDLASKKPELAKEWNYEKNGNLKPTNIVFGSSKTVWWKCSKCNNEWKASLNNRVKGNSCPYCSSKKIKEGYNDLKTTNSELLEEWDYEKNNILQIYPNKIGKGSYKKVWWKCKKGHEWQTSIYLRCKGHGCPICAINKSAKSKSKKVMQYSTEGEFIAEYNSITEAIKNTKISKISDVCRNKRKTAGGYIWKYK